MRLHKPAVAVHIGVVEKVGRQTRGYKIAGTTGDGVRILEPKTKPTHFTSSEIRATIAKLKGDIRASRPTPSGATSKSKAKRG